MQKEIVICGAGIAGISAAYHLSVKHGVGDILLIDERPPLSLTSDKSTECYRNWWPDPAMTALMNHSIDLLEELADNNQNTLNLNRRGYLFVTKNSHSIPELWARSQAISENGGGKVRHHREGGINSTYIPVSAQVYKDQPSGADLITSKAMIKTHFPYLSSETEAVLHVRRAGWLSAQQLGTYLMQEARSHGVTLFHERITNLLLENNQVKGVELSNGRTIKTNAFIGAAGPLIDQVAKMAGIDLPIFHELHQKFALRDTLSVIPRQAPLIISSDPVHLNWTEEERSFLVEENEANEFLFAEMPPGAHLRPEGGIDSQIVLMLWEYQSKVVNPVFPPLLDEIHPEVTLRGLTKLIPDLVEYIHRHGRLVMDGGYYTRTPENRPLIGPTPVKGFYLLGALSGFGIMAACAAGDLLARHVCQRDLPTYAKDFLLARYQDPGYLEMVKSWNDQGQL